MRLKATFAPLKRRLYPENFQKSNGKNNRNNSLLFKKQWSTVFPPFKFFLAESQEVQPGSETHFSDLDPSAFSNIVVKMAKIQVNTIHLIFSKFSIKSLLEEQTQRTSLKAGCPYIR